MTRTNTEKTTKPTTSSSSKRAPTSTKRSSKTKTQNKARATTSRTKLEPDSELQARVQAYLDEFCDAMTSGDVQTVAALWAIPAFIVDKNDTRVVHERREVEEFFRGAPEMYAQRGIDDTRAEIEHLDVIDETLVLVTVRWPYIDAQGEEIGEESSTYTLKADSSGNFKMCVCTMRGQLTAQTWSDRELSH